MWALVAPWLLPGCRVRSFQVMEVGWNAKLEYQGIGKWMALETENFELLLSILRQAFLAPRISRASSNIPEVFGEHKKLKECTLAIPTARAARVEKTAKAKAKLAKMAGVERLGKPHSVLLPI